MRLLLCEKPDQTKNIGRAIGATRRGYDCLTGSPSKPDSLIVTCQARKTTGITSKSR